MNEIFLVALSQPETAAQLLRVAWRAAERRPQVRLEILAVRVPPEIMLLPSEGIFSESERGLLSAREADRTAKLRDAYECWAAETRPGPGGPDCDWIELEGLPAAEIASRGGRADLVILDRPSTSLGGAGHQMAHAALFDTHRPVLFVPPAPGPTLGRHLAIAWKEDGRAVKALLPALRYFEAAEEVTVLLGTRDATPVTIPTPLVERGITPAVHRIAIGSEPFGRSLLAEAHALGVDLLVMGAYTHHPVREMLFGGVTRYVLAHAEIPVLMRH